MQIEETKLSGCYLIKPTVFEDSRGYFFESFNQKEFEKQVGINISFVQDNEAKSNYGVIRGLHFQKEEFAQAKLVSVVRGRVLDVVVDVRSESDTLHQTYAVELSDQNHYQLFVPRGFAHGYAVLEDNTVFTYKCDNYYNKESEGGIYYADEKLKIDWQIPIDNRIISAKDLDLQRL
jgi:dTDP-4-dehydrorhamnose 3,5-epimerase